MMKAQSMVKDINEAREADGVEEKINKEDDNPQLLGQAKSAMQDVCDMNVKNKNPLALHERVDMLSANQRRIFGNVNTLLHYQQQHETNKCACNMQPLRVFISGVGGTGKSFPIEAVKSLIDNMWPLDDSTYCFSCFQC